MTAWREVATPDGSRTLAHPVHGECLHSTSGAWTQARERYARGARVRAQAQEIVAARGTRLRLLDVGTGLGLNLAAALEALDGSAVALDAYTFERDAALLALAASAVREPASLERWHAPVREALRAALADPERASREGVPLASGRLWLHLGDARELLPALPAELGFDACFLDPFSPRVEPDLWSAPFLGAIARRLAPRATLATYSAAVLVRARLLAAGLRVGPGPAIGAKREGTLASPDGDVGSFPARLARRLEARAARVGLESDAPAGASGPAIP